MTELNQLAEDLRFVRGAVQGQRQRRYPPAVACIWAAYTLIGYPLLDLGWHRAATLFFLIGGVIGCIATAAIQRRSRVSSGFIDSEDGRRQMLHWFGGFALIVAGGIAAELAIPALRGQAGGQVIVMMVGLMYFLAGANNRDVRYLIWGGPLVMAGGIAVGFIHYFGWTALGVLIAAVILLPAFARRTPRV